MSDKQTLSAPGERATQLRVLVVDDEPLIGMTLRILLDEHDVVLETSGRAARDRLANAEEFDVILCDLMLEDVSGMQLAAWVKEHRPALEARLIFMSGGAFTDDARAFMRAIPRERQLEKPFSADEIESLLARY